MCIAGALIEWEAANPQDLEAEELMKRLVFTYSAALACFRHYPVRGTNRFGLTIEMAIVTRLDWQLIYMLDPLFVGHTDSTCPVRAGDVAWYGRCVHRGRTGAQPPLPLFNPCTSALSLPRLLNLAC